MDARPTGNLTKLTRWILIVFQTLVFVLGAAAIPSSAQNPPLRKKVVTINYYEHEWWLVRWSDDNVACEMYVDHEGQPTPLEIFYQCGETLYLKWLESPPCQDAADPNHTECPGYYLHHTQKFLREKSISIQLPEPEVRLEIDECSQYETQGVCSTVPHLVLIASEPLPNEEIIQIQGEIDGDPFHCQGDRCDLPLQLTGKQGKSIRFWALSTFGDSSQQYRGRVRVVKSLMPEAKGQEGYHISLVGDSFPEDQQRTCSQIWHALPPLGEPPGWLANSQHAEQLATDEPLTYLAGQLIKYKLANASACPDGGLLQNGYASPCGLMEARWEVTRWQNRLDRHILHTARGIGIPSQLLKNVLIQESQLWPTTMEGDYQEYGLGHTTELGAETTLLWNETLYKEFCPYVIGSETCQRGYPNLTEDQKALLRGAFLKQSSVDIEDIVYNEDLELYRDRIDLFAKSLVGHCQQTQQMITNITGKKGGDVASYEDLWKYTIANYNAGSRCIGDALDQTSRKGLSLTWENVSTTLNVNCPAAVEYIDTITR